MCQVLCIPSHFGVHQFGDVPSRHINGPISESLSYDYNHGNTYFGWQHFFREFFIS